MSLFNKKKKEPKENLVCYKIYSNDIINNIYNACTSCYDNKKDISYDDKKKYIAKRIKAGHDSILEHGTVVYLMTGLRKENYYNYISLFNNDAGFYIHNDTNHFRHDIFKVASSRQNSGSSYENNETYNIVIGGSIRGIKHFIKTNIQYNGFDNVYFRVLFNKIISTIPLELFEDMTYRYDLISCIFDDYVNNAISTGRIIVYDEDDDKTSSESDNNYLSYNNAFTTTVDYNDYDNKSIVIGCDTLDLYNFVRTLENFGFDNSFVDRVLPVGICFINMSRTATHQLLRHRNAITQESQRYVDYRNSSFTCPDISYINKNKFDVTIFNHTAYNVTLKELGDELLKIYNQLINQKVKKEDARAFLPSNVNCGKLYMTFTLSTLRKFIELRSDSHAQGEIRSYAKAIEKSLYFIDSSLFTIKLTPIIKTNLDLF